MVKNHVLVSKCEIFLHCLHISGIINSLLLIWRPYKKIGCRHVGYRRCLLYNAYRRRLFSAFFVRTFCLLIWLLTSKFNTSLLQHNLFTESIDNKVVLSVTTDTHMRKWCYSKSDNSGSALLASSSSKYSVNNSGLCFPICPIRLIIVSRFGFKVRFRFLVPAVTSSLYALQHKFINFSWLNSPRRWISAAQIWNSSMVFGFRGMIVFAGKKRFIICTAYASFRLTFLSFSVSIRQLNISSLCHLKNALLNVTFCNDIRSEGGNRELEGTKVGGSVRKKWPVMVLGGGGGGGAADEEEEESGGGEPAPFTVWIICCSKFSCRANSRRVCWSSCFTSDNSSRRFTVSFS